MIKSLSITNYALIQELEMSPSSKLNIITGETGAGKSIMLGAVGLLLGNRADTRALYDDSNKCVVEGIFDVSEYDLKVFFDENDLDYEHECIIRREISPAGKSRAFVNDSPVTLDILKNLGVKLIDIHSQHESLDLADNKYQVEIIDLFAQNQSLKNQYTQDWKSFKKAEKVYQTLLNSANDNAQDLEFKQYLLDELQAAKLEQGEQETLEEELQLLENAETITSSLGNLADLLENADVSIINQLGDANNLLSGIRNFSKNFTDLYERLHSTTLELEDISKELRNELDKVELDPEKLQYTKDRLDLIYKLQQKHRVQSVSDLLQIQVELEQALSDVLNLDDQILKAEKALVEAEKALLKSGEELSSNRKKSAPEFCKNIEKMIHKMGIENGSLTFNISTTTPVPSGLDHVELLFSANKGIAPKEVKHVASGGEFSRLIFAIKYLLADKTALPTIIFDEIDTGVSGEIALQMISMMQAMSQNHQVISISHLPQFAAGGDQHYYVYKDHTAHKSVSRIKQLEGEERVLAIAKMIGGDNPGENALASARELLAMH